MPILTMNRSNFKLSFPEKNWDKEKEIVKAVWKLQNGKEIIYPSSAKVSKDYIRYYPIIATLETAIALKPLLKEFSIEVTDKYVSYVRSLYKKEQEFRNTFKRINEIKRTDPQTIGEMVNGKFFIDDYEFKTEPWDHQKIGFLLMREVRAFMLNWDMRTGKTFAVSNLMQYFHNNTDLRRTVIFAPKDILDSTWIKDVYKHTDLEGYSFYQNTTKQKLKAMERGLIRIELPNGRFEDFQGEPSYFVFNHDSISNSDITDAILKYLKPDNLIIDEYHAFKGVNTNRSKAMVKFAKHFQERNGLRVGMSGTPFTKDIRDVYKPCEIMDKAIFPYGFPEFKRRFCIMLGDFKPYKQRDDNTKAILKGVKHQKEFKRRYLARSQRILIQDVRDMPEKIETIESIEMSPEQKRHHDTLKEELYADLPKGGVLPVTSLTKLIKLVQVTGGYIYDQDEVPQYLKKSPKLDKLQELLTSLLANDKNNVVVFSNYKPAIMSIRKMLVKVSYGFEELTTLSSNRAYAEADFLKHADRRIILAQPRLCPGKDFSKANYAIFFDNTYMMVDREQADRRIFTPDSLKHGKVVTIDLLCNNSVDLMIWDRIMSKKLNNDELTAEYIRKYLG